MREQAVLTLACGNPVYVKMAWNLGRSFNLWNRESGIRFVVATDQDVMPPADLKFVEIVKIRRGEFGTGFSPKLHLDRLAPADETLFIDADCLCVAPLQPVFDAFTGHDVSVVGRIEHEGELFGDIALRCLSVGAPWTVRFCGGLYFLRRGGVCAEIFDSARRLEGAYDELGMLRLRGVPNEEPLIALGMALAGERPIREDGSIKAEPMFFSGPVVADVFRGRARLLNISSKPKPYPEWGIPPEARPRIIHFNASFAEHPPYTVEAKRMELVLNRGWPLPLATLFTRVSIELPYRSIMTMKNALRPVYRMLFGARPVKRSARVLHEDTWLR